MDENENVKILDTTLEDVIHTSMIPYAEYVIMDRAIPRVEDGLKPVQRRVLYTMYELGITPDKPTKKSARIVGDCLGKFHPHGDSSVYGALVRLAQEFSIRNVLVNGQGNFGSIDGDGAAAMRYTEAKLSPLAMELLRGIDKNTVDFTNNFDDTLTEPVTLPGRFPNLLVNGAYGIAVGLATNIPTHNLGETIDGVVYRINHPNSSLADVMKYIKGPDFPSGGYIIATDLVNAYETGRGRIIIRAKCEIESEKGRESIVITELPYQVNKALLQQKIIALREDKNELFQGISDVVDESDMSGIRVIIKIKKDYNANEILEELYKRSDLSISFNINMVAIADGKPKQMSLIEILDCYIKYQIKVILRRSKFEYDEAKSREHILEALVVAVRNIDEVVEIIKSSKTTAEAKTKLMNRFSLDSEQAQAILDLRLARLTSLEVFKLEKELEELKTLIKNLLEIIKSEDRQKQVLISEINVIKKNFADDRRSIIVDSAEEIEIYAEKEKAAEESVMYFNGLGEVKRVPKAEFNKTNTSLKENSDLSEVIYKHFETMSDRVIRIFTDLGNCYKFTASELPNSKVKEKHNPSLIIAKKFIENEKIVKIFDFEGVNEDLGEVDQLIFFTESGAIKRTTFEEYDLSRKDSCQAIKLKEGDRVVNVELFRPETEIFMASKSGMCLRAENKDIPLQGRVSMGVKGMILSEGDAVVSAMQIEKAGEIFVVTDKGFGKRVILSNIPTTARARKGVKLIEFKDKAAESVVYAGYVTVPFDIAVVGDTNDVTSVSTEDLRIEKRETRGKPIENVKFFEKIVSAKPHKN